MPYGSLNLSDPRNRFSGLNPYLQQPQRTASTQQPPANQVEMQELRTRTQPPRSMIMVDSDNDEDLELGGAHQQEDFDNRAPQQEQLEEEGYFSCLGSFVSSAYQAIKSATSHLVCGQGSLTGEIYGTIGMSGTYPAFTLGSLPDAIKTVGDSSFNPTTAGINAHQNFGLGTEWASTGSPSYNPFPYKDGSVGGLYGTITGGLSSAVGTLGSLSKLWDASSAAIFSHDMHKAVNIIHQERVELEGLRIHQPDEDEGGILQIQVIEDNPKSLEEKITALQTNIHKLLGCGLTLSPETRIVLNRDHHTLGQMIQKDIWREDFNENDVAIFSLILERQITFQTHLEDSVRNFAQMKGVEGLTDFKEGGVGFLASLNGMANAIMTGISLTHPTNTPVGNQLAAGLISTQALGSCFSCFTGCMGAYSDHADYSEAVDLVAQSRQFRNANPDSRMAPVSELVSRENEMRSGYKALTGTKNFIMGSSGTVLLSASLMGGVSAAAVVTPIGWALAGGASVLGLYSAGVEKWLTKREQEKDLKQEPHIQQRLEQESRELQTAMVELEHFEEREAPLLASLNNRRPAIDESMGAFHIAIQAEEELSRELEKQDSLVQRAQTGLHTAQVAQNTAVLQCQTTEQTLERLQNTHKGLKENESDLLLEVRKSEKKQISRHTQTLSLEQDLNQLKQSFSQIEQQIKSIPVTEENKHTLNQLNSDKNDKITEIKHLKQLLSKQKIIQQTAQEKHTQLTLSLEQTLLALEQVGAEIKTTEQTLIENQSELRSCVQKVDGQQLRLNGARETQQALSEQREKQTEIIQDLERELGAQFQAFDSSIGGLREAFEANGFKGAYECLLDQQTGMKEQRDILTETVQIAQRTVTDTENELKRAFPTSAVRAIIEDLRSEDPEIQTGAKIFVRDVLGVAEDSTEMRVIELGERAYAAELILSKLGLAYLS
ncbi:MAG: hypothetical protein IV090_05915 [Candidatus Sericytochromatia bacterium]|nr:hypothetical protein [Candidatus Sericytochromatia bacterium]